MNLMNKIGILSGTWYRTSLIKIEKSLLTLIARIVIWTILTIIKTIWTSGILIMIGTLHNIS